MKKILIYICITLLLISPVQVYAIDGNTASEEWGDKLDDEDKTDRLPEAVVDNNGWYKSGYMVWSDENVTYRRECNFLLDGSKLYLFEQIDANGSSLLISDGEQEFVITNSYKIIYSTYSDVGNWTNTFSSYLVHELGVDNFTWSSNLPYFSLRSIQEGKLDNYLNNGDVTGADNYEDIVKPEKTLETPKNVKVLTGFYEGSQKDNVWNFDKSIKIQWEKNCEEAVAYEIQYYLSFNVLKEKKQPSKVDYSVGSGWIPCFTSKKYKENEICDYTLTSEIMESTRDDKMLLACQNDSEFEKRMIQGSGIEGILALRRTDITGYTGFDYFFSNKYASMRIRNIDELGNYSDWVVVTLDYTNNSSDSFYEDDEGNTEENTEETDGRLDEDEPVIDIDDVDWDSDGDGSTGILDVIKAIIKLLSTIVSTIVTGIATAVAALINGTAGIFKFITGGFGLLGDNGVLKILSSTFTFVPDEIWTLIGTGISVVIALAIISYFRK